MKLYEIKAQIENCIKVDDDFVDTETGEVFDTEAFEQLEMDFEEKCLDLARWVKNLDAEREAVYNERRKLESREKAISRKMDSIRNYLTFVLEGRSMKDSNTEIGFRKSKSTEVNVIELMKWDNADSYLTYKEPVPNKTEIAKALKNGTDIPGCRIVENMKIQIK